MGCPYIDLDNYIIRCDIDMSKERLIHISYLRHMDFCSDDPNKLDLMDSRSLLHILVGNLIVDLLGNQANKSKLRDQTLLDIVYLFHMDLANKDRLVVKVKELGSSVVLDFLYSYVHTYILDDVFPLYSLH